MSEIGTVDVDVDAEPQARAPATAGDHRLSDRLALWVFVAYLGVAAVLVVTRFGEGRWFLLDEWAFLSGRSITDIDDLLRPHNEHLTLLPVVAFRLLFRAFGLESYLPYQLAIVGTHLTAVVLLRVVMRRAGATPWISTAVASTLVLFGAGGENIVWAFQIGFVGAFALGLGQLLLADHDGGRRGRDVAAALLGIAAIACVSSVGLVMVAVCGIAVLLRRGWRAAAAAVVPPLAVFALWWLVERPRNEVNPFGRPATEVARSIVGFAAAALRHPFTELGSHPAVGVLIAAVLVGGCWLAVRDRGATAARRELAAPGALAIGAVVFALLTASGRWPVGIIFAESERYTYLVAAFLLPALGVAVTALAARWRFGQPAAVVALVAVSAANVGDFSESQQKGEQLGDSLKAQIVAIAESPYATRVPRSLAPDPQSLPDLTVGWVIERRDDGHLPDVDEVPPLVTQGVVNQLALQQREGDPDLSCAPLRQATTIETEVGDTFGLASTAMVTIRTGVGGPPAGLPQPRAGYAGQLLAVTLPDTVLEVAPPPGTEVAFCPQTDRPPGD